MNVQIKHRHTDAVLFECNLGPEYDSESDNVRLGEAVSRAVAAGVDLRGANLTDVDLKNAYLGGVVLSGVDLTGARLTNTYLGGAVLRDASLADTDLKSTYFGSAVLSGADLTNADLTSANLNRADLRGADLTCAYLIRAYLGEADLRGAILKEAHLVCALLNEADFSGADLTDADFTNADIFEAKFEGALGVDRIIARTRILPAGDLIGWKKVRTPKGHAVIKLRIPAEAKRSNAVGRKCRAEFVDVLEAPEGAYTQWGTLITAYVAGQRVYSHLWDDAWQNECAGGIHFFITREEAEAY